mmetsp:Transcript_105165/g.165970  ORF Transcript_105165/g.165970 Transcript_105165/m.165970 type:complete len:436 (+) Transcript_105165:81-1388(+)
MRNAAIALLTTSVVLPVVVLGDINEDELELQWLIGDAGEVDYRDHHHHHRHHLRHHRHHRPFLGRHHKRAVLFAEAPSADRAEIEKAISKRLPAEKEAEELLPRRHPKLLNKLGVMDEELHELKARQQAAASARGSMEGEVKESLRHMNKAVKMRRELARAEIEIREEDLKLKRLEDDRLRLDRTHSHLVASLHHIMEPKINFAETRFTERMRRSKELEAEEQAWKAKEETFHKAAIAMLEERRNVGSKLEAAKEAVEKARHEQEMAEREMDAVKHGVSFNVEGYKYARTKERAAKSSAETSDEEMEKNKASVERLSNILSLEQRRVDDSMAHGKDRVQGKIRELEHKKERSTARLAHLEEEYHEWQQQQKILGERLAASMKTTHGAAEEYAKQQKDVLDIAQAKVVADAESDSDWAWNEWPGNGKPDEEEVHVN